MISRKTLFKSAAIGPVVILGAGLYLAVRPAMNSTPASAPEAEQTALARVMVTDQIDPSLEEDLPLELTFASGRDLWPGPGQSVSFAFESNGCFHSVSHRLEVSGERPDRLDVYMDGSAELSHTLELTPTMRTDIERVIAWMRSKPPGGCTTVEDVTIEWKNGTEVDGTEHLVDGTCWLSEKTEVKALDTIVRNAIEGLPSNAEK